MAPTPERLFHDELLHGWLRPEAGAAVPADPRAAD
jgi:hypothetical protein